MKKSLFRSAGSFVALALSAAACACVQAEPAPHLQMSVSNGQSYAASCHRRGLGVLVLDGSAASLRTEALLVHGSAARFALRRYPFMVLRKQADGSFRFSGSQGTCDDDLPYVAAGLSNGDKLSSAEVQATLGIDPAQGPAFVVFADHGHRPVGVAYGGFDSEGAAVRFASQLPSATPTRPLTAYAKALLDD